MTRGRHRRVVAPPTRLGPSDEGRLTPTETPARRADTPPQPAPSDTATEADRGTGSGPALPVRAGEDTDEGWGELPDGSDDARYLRDKPPHWQ